MRAVPGAGRVSRTLDVVRLTAPAPAVTAVSPASGPTTGGTPVTITGTNLTGATAITFGGTPATGVTCTATATATTCTATAPAGTAGTVDVRVTTPGGTSPITAADQYTYQVPPSADIDVNLAAQPHLGILVPYLAYTLTAHNTGPNAVTSATLTATLPAGASATNLSSGCTTSTGTVTCTYGAIANGASVNKPFRVPLSLLSLGHVTVTGVRTTSAPADPNPANDHASATCTVISIVLVTCPWPKAAGLERPLPSTGPGPAEGSGTTCRSARGARVLGPAVRRNSRGALGRGRDPRPARGRRRASRRCPHPGRPSGRAGRQPPRGLPAVFAAGRPHAAARQERRFQGARRASGPPHRE